MESFLFKSNIIEMLLLKLNRLFRLLFKLIVDLFLIKLVLNLFSKEKKFNIGLGILEQDLRIKLYRLSSKIKVEIGLNISL